MKAINAGKPGGAEGTPRLLRAQIADALEAAILTGEYAPGARLTERELVQRYGVSSIPVREALQDLEGRGLVVKLPNVGCRVVDLTVEDARAVTEMRRHLEPLVAGWAAARVTAKWHAPLKAQWRRMEDAAKRDDLSAFFHEDLGFHRMIWRIAGNRFAERALEMAVGPLFASGIVRGTQSGRLQLKKEAHKHKGVMQAVLDGDADGASQALLAMAREFEDHLQVRGAEPQGRPKNTRRKAQ